MIRQMAATGLQRPHGRNSRTPRSSLKVISDLDPNPPVSDAEVRLVTAMLRDVIDHILEAE
jgi:DNA primase